MTQNTSPTWQYRFREKFVGDDGLMGKYAYDENGDTDFMADALIKWFAQELQQARREAIEEAIEVSAGMKKKDDYAVRDYREGYNKAVKDIENALQSLLPQNDK